MWCCCAQGRLAEVSQYYLGGGKSRDKALKVLADYFKDNPLMLASNLSDVYLLCVRKGVADPKQRRLTGRDLIKLAQYMSE